MEALNEASGIKAEENRLKTLLEQNNIKKAEFTQRVIKNKSDAAVFNETMEREKAVLDDVSEKIAKLNTTNQEIKQNIAELDSKKENLDKEHRDVQQKFHIENSRLSSLKIWRKDMTVLGRASGV